MSLGRFSFDISIFLSLTCQIRLGEFKNKLFALVTNTILLKLLYFVEIVVSKLASEALPSTLVPNTIDTYLHTLVL